MPTGTVAFSIDGMQMRRPTDLNDRGQAAVTLAKLKPGEHTIRATYSGGGKYDYHSSSSPAVRYTVSREKDAPRPNR